MGILDQLKEPAIWQEFYEYKKERAHLSKRDEESFFKFINEQRYLSLTEQPLLTFDYPVKKLINKADTGKKRVVYSFSEDESMLLKLAAYLLYRYDDRLSDRCYSFRKNFGSVRAVREITAFPDIDELYCYKVDISNYFNSIDTELLLPMLKKLLADDPMFYHFLERLLSANRAYFDGELVEEQRGVMAGIPISPFLANVYLTELDFWFENHGIPYARYSDDILLFAENEEQLDSLKKVIADKLDQYHLKINREKESITLPHEAWSFLGISYCAGRADLSEATIRKMKGKIRRKARAIFRWRLKKNASAEHAQKVLIRTMNKKFYDTQDAHELTWSRWFFPLLSESAGLKEIDAYLQQYIRYTATGSHGKKNYDTRYSDMKELGYRSLVHEFYQFRENTIL